MIDLCQGPWPREGTIEELDAVIVNGNTPQDRSTDEGEQSGSPCISPSQISDCYLVEDADERQKAQVKQRNQVSAEVSRSASRPVGEHANSQPGWCCNLWMPFGEATLEIQFGLLDVEELVLGLGSDRSSPSTEGRTR